MHCSFQSVKIIQKVAWPSIEHSKCCARENCALAVNKSAGKNNSKKDRSNENRFRYNPLALHRPKEVAVPNGVCMHIRVRINISLSHLLSTLALCVSFVPLRIYNCRLNAKYRHSRCCCRRCDRLLSHLLAKLFLIYVHILDAGLYVFMIYSKQLNSKQELRHTRTLFVVHIHALCMFHVITMHLFT